jgi:hypothetical protein
MQNGHSPVRSNRHEDGSPFHLLKRRSEPEVNESGKTALRQLRDTLTSHIAGELRPLVQKFMDSSKAKCDGEDLRKQVLFRMLTFGVGDVFQGGAQLDKYLTETGIYTDWRNIPLVRSETVARHGLNLDLVGDVLSEQYRNIAKRIERSTIGLDNVTGFMDGFDGPEWHIRKAAGKISLLIRMAGLFH